MKRILVLGAAAALFALAGCASQGSVIETTYDKDGKALKSTEHRSDFASYAAAQQQTRPLFQLECPQPQGCNFTKLTVNDPHAGQGMQAPPESLAQTITKELFATVRGAVPYAAASFVLGKAFDKANSSVTTNVDNSNRSTNSSDSSNRSTTSNTSNTSTTTNTTTNTTTTSNSNNRTATGGNSGTTGSGGSASTGP